MTGRRPHHRRCTALPITDEVIDRVHDIAIRQKFPEGLIFLRQDGTEFVDVEANDEPDNDEPPH